MAHYSCQGVCFTANKNWSTQMLLMDLKPVLAFYFTQIFCQTLGPSCTDLNLYQPECHQNSSTNYSFLLSRCSLAEINQTNTHQPKKCNVIWTHCTILRVTANNTMAFLTFIPSPTWYAGQLQENTIPRPVAFRALVTLG